MNIVITGGGTGGHVNPGLAIADTVRKHDGTAKISFVGTSHGIENKLVPKAGYDLYHVKITGLRRKFTLENLKTLYLTVTSVSKAKKLLKKLGCNVVFATGGYVCYPVVKAAHKLHIPIVLHEANAIPGVAVKMLERYADTVYVNFEESKKYLKYPQKAIRVGNPIIGDICAENRDAIRKELGIGTKYEKMLLSFGGSMGAQQLNFAVLKLMRDYSKKHPEILHVHATGSIEYEVDKKLFAEYSLSECENIKLLEYIYDMPQKMAAADLVICRAGSMTLSELERNAKPSVLIPSPNVTNNHQFKNATVLSNADAAVVIEEKDLDSEALTKAVDQLLSNGQKLKQMSENALKFAVWDTNEVIYKRLAELAK